MRKLSSFIAAFTGSFIANLAYKPNDSELLIIFILIFITSLYLMDREDMKR